ncbi:MAG: divergent polysaccharide deacetylase family protein [Hyphomicrobiales bacterium]|nr:divergent polysaccharide deacetylase family protein [Hyphomicrobiales bacterium]
MAREFRREAITFVIKKSATDSLPLFATNFECQSFAGAAGLPTEPDDLHKPLGLADDPNRAGFSPRLRAFAAAASIGAGIAALTFLGGAADHAGEPFATASIEPAPPPSVSAGDTGDKGGEGERPAETAMASQVEADSGVEVVRPDGTASPGAMVIRVPDPPGTAKLAAAPDPRLVERSDFGPLPRIGADGARPAQVYARPAPPAAKGRPRIALVIGGLGLNDQTTNRAITKLPGEVSLAFAPYGTNLKAQAAKAREAGHEILLQMPMEPFDYAQNNPGPQTLTIDAGSARNIERLHWALARAAGFVGIENFLGGRFTADEAALSPVLKDLAERGLIFVDDGSSARSITAIVGPSLNLSVRRADVVIDAAPDGAKIDDALQRLESLARENGLATASGSALAVTLDHLSHWAESLSSRGIDLVPVTSTLKLKGRG